MGREWGSILGVGEGDLMKAGAGVGPTRVPSAGNRRWLREAPEERVVRARPGVLRRLAAWQGRGWVSWLFHVHRRSCSSTRANCLYEIGCK
jgi:hypothetical protein